MGGTLSNLYKYRNGKGNPTAKTIDKIVKAVEKKRNQLMGLNMRNEKQTEVYDLLYRLGVAANYTVFFHTTYAVLLCVE